MQNIPKIVRERLKAATPVGDHPDADVLTAFAERSLPDRERAVVLEHLARCGSCRDVLALALPTPEALQNVIAPARGGWLTWPALRWGLVAAGGIAIISLGILQYQRHLQPAAMVAKQVSSPEAVATNIQTPPTSPSPAATPAEKEEKSVAEAPSSLDALSGGRVGAGLNPPKLIAPAGAPQASARQLRSSGGVVARVGGGQLLHGPAMPTQWQQQTARVQAAAAAPSAEARQQSADVAASAPIPSASEVVEVQVPAAAAPVNPETKNEQVPQQFGYSVGKAKPAVNNGVVATAPAMTTVARAARQPTASRTTAANASMLPRWNITPAGGLQRSFDQGQTWQDVDVNASSRPAANYTNLAVVAKTAPAKDSFANKKVTKEPTAAFVFRVVAAVGPEVWVGGSSGALYHSLDAGSHWTQVLPSAEGAALTGDIVGLEFPDAQHGKITTSTAEIWITSDGGQTWQRQ